MTGASDVGQLSRNACTGNIVVAVPAIGMLCVICYCGF